MKHYIKKTLEERKNTTPEEQRHTIYQYIEENIAFAGILTDSQKSSLSKALDDLAKIHNSVLTIEVNRVTEALERANKRLEKLEKVKAITIKKEAPKRPKQVEDEPFFNMDFLNK